MLTKEDLSTSFTSTTAVGSRPRFLTSRTRALITDTDTDTQGTLQNKTSAPACDTAQTMIQALNVEARRRLTVVVVVPQVGFQNHSDGFTFASICSKTQEGDMLPVSCDSSNTEDELQTGGRTGYTQGDGQATHRRTDRLHTGGRTGYTQGDGQATHRGTDRLHTGGRTGYTQGDGQATHRRTDRLHTGGRTGYTQGDGQATHRGTDRLHTGGRTGYTQVRSSAVEVVGVHWKVWTGFWGPNTKDHMFNELVSELFPKTDTRQSLVREKVKGQTSPGLHLAGSW